VYKRQIIACYLEKGADGWVKFGGIWNGSIEFASVHPEERYRVVLETAAVHDAITEGATIVDSRQSTSYNTWHIPGSINLPIIYTPTSKLTTAFEKIPSGTTLITVCDDFVSCFDAKLVGLKAEQDRGVTFKGRYAKPWDYRNNY
jgi:rhodanese-related sulfurtransferase